MMPVGKLNKLHTFFYIILLNPPLPQTIILEVTQHFLYLATKQPSQKRMNQVKF